MQNGITLIALVVTTVVLLILAGVSINLVIGQNGIITKARDAKEATERAAVNDQIAMNSLYDELAGFLNGSNGGNGGGSYDPASEGVTIPAGFYYVGGTKDSGLVISDNSADENKYQGQTTVGTELQGNQFVWIPVDTIADYKRTAYSINVATGTTDSATNSEQIKFSDSVAYYFTEAMPEDEKISVETYHGFYIGRYEAGDAESTTSKTKRTRGASTTNTITLKKGQAPYNYVTKTQAQSLAEGMKAKQGYSAKTKLCSSYAWDTAIAFIQKTNSDYGDSSEEGNYKDTPDFSYKDITGANKTKSQNNGVLIPTGQTTPVCNIYDMGGNCWELTTELYSYSRGPCTVRGGNYDCNYADTPAGSRSSSLGYAYDDISFRPTLFM